MPVLVRSRISVTTSPDKVVQTGASAISLAVALLREIRGCDRCSPRGETSLGCTDRARLGPHLCEGGVEIGDQLVGHFKVLVGWERFVTRASSGVGGPSRMVQRTHGFVESF
jgi:hypothetical protein